MERVVTHYAMSCPSRRGARWAAQAAGGAAVYTYLWAHQYSVFRKEYPSWRVGHSSEVSGGGRDDAGLHISLPLSSRLSVPTSRSPLSFTTMRFSWTRTSPLWPTRYDASLVVLRTWLKTRVMAYSNMPHRLFFFQTAQYWTNFAATGDPNKGVCGGCAWA